MENTRQTGRRSVGPSLSPRSHRIALLDDQSSRAYLRRMDRLMGGHAHQGPRQLAQPRERVVATTVDNSLPRRLVEDAYLLRASRRFGALGPRRPGTRTVRQLPLATRPVPIAGRPDGAGPRGEASGVNRHSDKHAPRNIPEAQDAFKVLMIHWILQVARRIAFRCVLHRWGSQDIRR